MSTNIDNINSTSQNEELFAEFVSKYRSDLPKEQKALEIFLDEAEPSSMYISVLNQVIKKYQKEQWLYKEMELCLESVDMLLRELFLLRTFCVRAQFNGLIEPDEKIKNHVNSTLECCQRFYTEKKNMGF